jgi:hypothetical protein
MAAPMRLRDAMRLALPWWLSERRQQNKTVGYRFLWALVAVLDVLLEGVLQGLYAAWPGAGTPTALPYIGRSRGVLRGMDDTNDDYAAKLRGWLERAEQLGTMFAIARELHEYLPGRPRVRVINRHQHWLTINTDGTLEKFVATWDWDSVSNPERVNWWSELWVIIYTDKFDHAGAWGDGRSWGTRDSGLGLTVAKANREALANLVADAKSAHSQVRCVIWTTDDTQFDPAVPASCPDGTWGEWSLPRTDPRVPGGRVRTCRYWEPKRASDG